MRKISGIVLSVVMLLVIGVAVVNAQETRTYDSQEYRLADTPSKFGFRGLYNLYSYDTAQAGKYGFGLFWEMSRFCLPGDPRYPQLMEISLGGYYGITDRIEIGMSAPFRMLKIPADSGEGLWPEDEANDEISESGFGNLSAGVRFSLLSPESDFNITPFIQAFLPTATDPEKGSGAENTRIHFGMSAGMPLGDNEDGGAAKLYSQVAYQYATSYDQDRRDFTERGRYSVPHDRPRFEYFGTNPLYQEYGNTLFYGAGLSFPIIRNTMELFGEFLFYHSFEDADYIPMFEDQFTPGEYEPLDVVQDGGMAHVGAQVNFGNGVALKGGWGGILYAEEPMYESATWRAFAGLTYMSPHDVVTVVDVPDVIPVEQYDVGDADGRTDVDVGTGPIVGVKCDDLLDMMVYFEFDKSTLTPEALATLRDVGRLLRMCEGYYVEVGGHTDWMGTENYNMGLGNRRARAVVYELVYDQGIDPSQVVLNEKMSKAPPVIAGETYGESDPIASNETDAGRAQNRRVQFKKM